MLLLYRGFVPNQSHVATTRPHYFYGYKLEATYAIFSSWSNMPPNTVAIYECKWQNNRNFVSVDSNCEGKQRMFPTVSEYLFSDPSGNEGNTAPLYRCYIPRFRDHFITTDPNCETPSARLDGLLGYYISNLAAFC